MSSWQLKTPVVLIIFNRPDTTQKVFNAIREAKPPQLLVVADGPRPNVASDQQRCADARAIIDQVDWDCEVLTKYSEINLGCGVCPAQGLSWAFEQVEEAIILEDDCLPDPTFFQFCEEMLIRYRDDERIMIVLGTNVLGEWKSLQQSYHFSYCGPIWGWASWRRAWQYFDFEAKLWASDEVKARIKDVLADDYIYQLRRENFNGIFQGKKKDVWDYQWSFARLAQSGLSLVPSVNLISNIGFSKDATHTTFETSEVARLKTTAITFPLQDSGFVAVDREYDRRFYVRMGHTAVNRMKGRIKKGARRLGVKL